MKTLVHNKPKEVPLKCKYEKHKVFETPPHSCSIWRYMSFTKFAWMIATKSLYFSRLDQLKDEWEGLIATTPENIESRKHIRFNSYINSWHINDVESDAMWKLYGPPGETIAIKTTVGYLIESLESGLPVYVGRINYDEQRVPEGNLYWPVIFKRKPFEHENELRLCISSPFGDNLPDSCGTEPSKGIVSKRSPKSISVYTQLNKLIREVVTCPDAKDYLRESIDYIVKRGVPHTSIRESKI